MAEDLRQLLPKDKCDVAGARAIVGLGYPAVAPVLPELLEWLQDCKWPVSRPISEFLVTIPEAVAPLVWDVLRGDDDIWKYWCIVCLIGRMPAGVAGQFREELTRLAERPTVAERLEELDEVAREALEAVWPGGGGGA